MKGPNKVLINKFRGGPFSGGGRPWDVSGYKVDL